MLRRRSTTRVVDPLGSVASTPGDVLTQHEAAAMLRVSTRYLRDSTCPMHRLPGNGSEHRAVVRYERSEVMAWFRSGRNPR